MKAIDRSKPVFISGATGYVAGWIVKKLLEEGFTVHAAVRDPNNTNKLKELNSIASDNPGSIKYFKSNLLEANSYKDAMEGCELVFHTASPFKLKIKDAQKELVDPALKGTENLLKTVNETSSVKRVVLTSSVAAIYGDVSDSKLIPNGIFSEANWNTTSSLKNSPYSYSKTLAEKRAWEIEKEQSRWDLVVINPSFVMGPGISPSATSESFKFMKQMIDGSTKMGVPSLEFGVVDVRDLALAHFNAAFMENTKGRHIISADSLSMLQIAKMIGDKFGNKFPVAKKELPKFLMYLTGPFIGFTFSWVKNNVGWHLKFDNSKSRNELKLNYRPLDETIIEFVEQISTRD
jgi:nucleoside-diphosphate-sugar epimerase